MLQESEAWILSSAKLGEADQVVEFLSRDQGRKRAAARGSRRRYSRFRGAIQPLARGWIAWYEREGSELARLRAIEIDFLPRRLAEDLEGVLLATYLSDLIGTFSPEGEPAQPLFRLLDAVVPLLEKGENRSALARYAEVWVLRLAGLLPARLSCPDCGRDIRGGGRVDAGDGGLRCNECRSLAGAIQVGEDGIAALRDILQLGPEKFLETAAPVAALEEIARLSGVIRRAFLQQELPSRVVLEEALATVSGTSPNTIA